MGEGLIIAITLVVSIGFVILFGVAYSAAKPYLSPYKIEKYWASMGYKYCGMGSFPGVGWWVYLEKDGDIFCIKKGKTSLNELLPIEVTELREVSQNTHLVELEIRYEYGDKVESTRIRGPYSNGRACANTLLTYKKRFGF